MFNDFNSDINSSFQEKESKIDDEPIKRLKNPYIIIFGISKYTNENIKSLKAVPQDVDMLYKVFKNEYNYRHVYKNLDSLSFNDTTFKANKRHFVKFLRYHHKQITELEDIDSLIFTYSGHGVENTILFGDGTQFTIPKIQQEFDNETLDILAGKPKIFFFDCCRGMDIEGKEKPNNRVFMKNEDMISWYGSASGYKSFERQDKNGSVFTCAITETFLECSIQEQYSKWDINTINRRILRKVLMNSKCQQTPQVESAVSYQIFFEKGNGVHNDKSMSKTSEIYVEKTKESWISKTNKKKSRRRRDGIFNMFDDNKIDDDNSYNVVNKKMVKNRPDPLVMMLEIRDFLDARNNLLQEQVKTRKGREKKASLFTLGMFAGAGILTFASGGITGLAATAISGLVGLTTSFGVFGVPTLGIIGSGVGLGFLGVVGTLITDGQLKTSLKDKNYVQKQFEDWSLEIQKFLTFLDLFDIYTTHVTNREKFNKESINKKYLNLKKQYEKDEEKSKLLDLGCKYLVEIILAMDYNTQKMQSLTKFHQHLKTNSNKETPKDNTTKGMSDTKTSKTPY